MADGERSRSLRQPLEHATQGGRARETSASSPIMGVVLASLRT
jgi:hypothetical protein